MTVDSEATAGRGSGARDAAPGVRPLAGAPPLTPTGQSRVDSALDPWSMSLDACFHANYARVLAYCLRRMGDRQAAEDAAAQTFLVAWRRKEVLPADQLPWLLGIARHVILGEHRSVRRRERLLSRLASEPTPTSSESHPVPTTPASIHVALAELSEPDREVLMLTTWDGLDQGHAAAVLGCSLGAFKVRLHRARKRLAIALDNVSYISEEY